MNSPDLNETAAVGWWVWSCHDGTNFRTSKLQFGAATGLAVSSSQELRHVVLVMLFPSFRLHWKQEVQRTSLIHSFIKHKTSAVLLFCAVRFLTRVRWSSISVIVSTVLSRLRATVRLPEEAGSWFLEKGSDWWSTTVSFTLLQSGLCRGSNVWSHLCFQP